MTDVFSYINTDSLFITSRTMSSIRCTFCNSGSHATERCNSNFKGRRTHLDSLRECMLHDKAPTFGEYPVNELRYIASLYKKFQKTVHLHNSIAPCILRVLNSHIPMTLTKRRLVNELMHRWNLYDSVRERKLSEPICDDCPICLDNMSIPIWNPRKLNWELISIKRDNLNASFNGNILTECKHEFCGACWERHLDKNGKLEYLAIGNEMTILCPLCRHKMIYSI